MSLEPKINQIRHTLSTVEALLQQAEENLKDQQLTLQIKVELASAQAEYQSVKNATEALVNISKDHEMTVKQRLSYIEALNGRLNKLHNDIAELIREKVAMRPLTRGAARLLFTHQRARSGRTFGGIGVGGGGGAALFARWMSNNAHFGLGLSNMAFGTIGRVYLSPFYIPFAMTIDYLAYITGTTAAGNVRLGLYRRGVAGFPDLPDGGALVVETAAFAQTNAAMIHCQPIVDTVLAEGAYFGAVQGDNVTGTFYRLAYAMMRDEAIGNVNYARYYDHAFGAFTNPCPVTVGTNPPIFLIRVKSVP